ncbi:DMT family transporter [Paenibacillus apiarius]|uniref:DMT family transporter n=1 Tax=Paenibacillus apiarius TaxID=46240 RepID=A0ABT4DQW2_9BACL|nr:DMT family transporter [Paenibacillus apiarius]MCY9513408.1 DMT family transporter [Paenibacillus apiarius]MCY9519620.1 DMT family transporter [Paenibacillus apiarius]MCY9553324.1 DMT family transporter [Paenibacillus apiarius]MCY9557174.1 DMT family transporter [Paenibacillus apiarius]MCY9682085.1 DMT family transporter [Paenibacillus apiarius]
MSSRKSSHLYALLVIGMIAISFSAILVKWSAAPAPVIGMYRLLLTNLLLLPWVWSYRAEWRSIQRRDWFRLTMSGFFLGLHFLLWMESLRHTTVASSTALLTLEPILVMAGSFWLFKQRTTTRAIFGVAVSLFGVILIGWGDLKMSGQALYGDLLSVLGTIAVVAHMLLGQDLRQRVSSYAYNFTVFLVAGACLAAYNLSAGYAMTGYGAQEWVLFSAMAIIPTVLGHMLFNWLLKYMNATSISMAVLGEPVGASILAWVLLGEAMNPLQMAACLLLIFGVWLFLVNDRKAPHREPVTVDVGAA